MTSAAQCKLCGLPDELRADIDKRLRSGQSHTELVRILDSHGVEVARSSVGRHASKHLGITERPRPPKPPATVVRLKEPPDDPATGSADTTPPDPFLNLEQLRAEVAAANTLALAVSERRVSQVILERIVQNQLAMVSRSQAEFMRGLADYPREPLNGLKILLDMLAKFPPYDDELMALHARQADVDIEAGAILKREAQALRNRIGTVYTIGQFHECQDHLPELVSPLPAIVKALGGNYIMLLDLSLAQYRIKLESQQAVIDMLQGATEAHPDSPEDQWRYCVDFIDREPCNLL